MAKDTPTVILIIHSAVLSVDGSTFLTAAAHLCLNPGTSTFGLYFRFQ